MNQNKHVTGFVSVFLLTLCTFLFCVPCNGQRPSAKTTISQDSLSTTIQNLQNSASGSSAQVATVFQGAIDSLKNAGRLSETEKFPSSPDNDPDDVLRAGVNKPEELIRNEDGELLSAANWPGYSGNEITYIRKNPTNALESKFREVWRGILGYNISSIVLLDLWRSTLIHELTHANQTYVYSVTYGEYIYPSGGKPAMERDARCAQLTFLANRYRRYIADNLLVEADELLRALHYTHRNYVEVWGGNKPLSEFL